MVSHFKSQSILTQVDQANNVPFPILSYKIRNEGGKPKLLLTGWNPPKSKYSPGGRDYNDTQAGDTNFGECYKWANSNISQPKGKIANGCVYGGRSGYSVKMISKCLFLNLGYVANRNIPSWCKESCP